MVGYQCPFKLTVNIKFRSFKEKKLNKKKDKRGLGTI